MKRIRVILKRFLYLRIKQRTDSMKTIFSLILSLGLATVLCLALVAGGVLKINGQNRIKSPKSVLKKAKSHATAMLDALAENLDGTSSPGKQRDLTDPPVKRAPQQDLSLAPDRQSFIHTQALEFFATEKTKDGADIEDRFTKFLQQELKLNPEEIQRFVRMSFWKNFLTLQEHWKPEEKDKIVAVFNREKKLKQAGFAARGLMLLTSEIREAEEQLAQINDNIKEPPLEGVIR